MTKFKNPDYSKWQRLDCIFVLMAFVYYMLFPLSPAYWGSIYLFYFRIAASAAIAFYIYFRHSHDVPDVKIVFAFGIWLIITRIINGDVSLGDEGNLILDFWTAALLLGSFAMLQKKERSRLFDCICAAMGLFHAFLAAAAIYSAVEMLSIPYPDFLLFDASFCNYHDGRLYMLANNTNICGSWFYISMAMMLYELIKQKKWYLKAAAAAAGLLSFMGLALTRSRSSILAAAFVFAAMAVLVFLRYCHRGKKSLRLIAATVIFAVIVPLAYSLFGVSADVVGAFSEQSSSAAQIRLEGEATEDVTEAGTHSRDVDVFTDTGRIWAYKSLFYTLKNDPARIIRGNLREGEMDIANVYLGKSYTHYHNSVLQSLDFTGLPGFIAVFSFFLLMTLRSFRLIFSGADIGEKCLALTLLGLMFYNMLETSAFYYTDVRELCFFALSGMIIAAGEETVPLKFLMKK